MTDFRYAWYQGVPDINHELGCRQEGEQKILVKDYGTSESPLDEFHVIDCAFCGGGMVGTGSNNQGLAYDYELIPLSNHELISLILQT